MKRKLLVVSGLIICCIIMFLYWSTLKVQIQLPSEQWSRSFQVDSLTSNFSKLQSVSEENGYTLSLLDFRKLVVLSCDMDMICEENRRINRLNTYKNTWSNKTDSYYIRGDSLIQANSSSKETKIASNVSNFSMSDDVIVYWTENRDLTVQIVIYLQMLKISKWMTQLLLLK
ncbi:hypothetical protein [Bacillus sp. FJAT-22090]|uniref:hypothetical protein n=1 Tax=Bacillus sp. FJAT-22090 TaxID=1581038 RepID=UPI0011A10FB1|nr:hypothetical protein [Bacillus sp. FJAT-22090]